MKNYFKLFTAAITIFSILACSIEDDVKEIQDNLSVQELSITVVNTTESSIELSWPDLEGVSWYQISYGESLDNVIEVVDYQDIQNDPLTYTIRNLDPETSYEISIEGTAYLNDGEVLAEGTASSTTEAAVQ